MSIPLVDLRDQYASLKGEINQAISEVLDSGEFILGHQVRLFEEEVATYCGARYGVGVGSGTEALHLALLACGVMPGDEVITTTFTFIATAEAIIHCGAKPVFADIEPTTYNLDWRQIERLITKRTRAIIPVHLYGHPVDMDPLLDVARRFRLKVVEDCAQAMGAKYKGRPVGSLGDAGCFSFFPSKNLGAYGDAGMVVSSDDEVSHRIELLRNHGTQHRFHYIETGFNSRLDTIQAAILRIKLRHLDSWVSCRKGKASFYNEFLGDVPGLSLPAGKPYAEHAFNYYTMRVTGQSIAREELKEQLASGGIASAVYYPLSLHLQPALRELGYQTGDLPNAEQAQQEVLSLPLYPEMDHLTQKKVVDAIKRSRLENTKEMPSGGHL